MQISRRNFQLGGLASLVCGLTSLMTTRTPASISNKDSEFLRDRDSKREIFLIDYEEWKAAVESPTSAAAEKFKRKSSFTLEYGDAIYDLLSNKEKEEINNVLRTFTLDIVKAKPEKGSKEQLDAFMKYTLPELVDKQIDLDNFYRHQFNFICPSKGERILIGYHFLFGFKYAAEGKHRKTYLEKRSDIIKK